ncbi:hypothetical protein [Streptomyces boninensis]|uniref:hypothetical protein n=1 Tax=Streptomyces boninensis TaxID=2039455 RepID=UPI003B20D3CE
MPTSTIFHAAADARVWCHEYDTERGPILALHTERSGVSICSAETVSIADQLAFARELAVGATAYLSAMEHYAAALPAKPDGAKAA